MDSTSQTRRLARRSLRLSWWLVRGALTTLAVAWCFAVWSQTGYNSGPGVVLGITADGRVFDVATNRGWGVANCTVQAGRYGNVASLMPPDDQHDCTAYDVTAVEELLPGWTATATIVQTGDLAAEGAFEKDRLRVLYGHHTVWFDHFTWEEAAGWPCLCVRSLYTTDGMQRHSYRLPLSIRRFMPKVQGAELPYRPIPRGFVLNTLFYAAMWLLLLAMLRALRGQLRRHRGHCPCCRYDLRGELASGCPECGWNRV